jgi:hypothetical protein
VDPRNASQTAVLDDEAKAYFQKIAPQLTAAGVTLSEQQMRWYSAERRAQGVFMKRENPTFLEECWSAPVQGAIYTEQIEKAHAQGRIFKMPVDG